MRQFVACAIEDVHHELMSVLAVVDVAGPVQDIEELPGLGHGAKQVVVAARAFLLGVVADGGTFGMPARGRHRAVEVEGQAGEAFPLERVYHQARRQVAHSFDIGRAHFRQRAADRGHVRQAA